MTSNTPDIRTWLTSIEPLGATGQRVSDSLWPLFHDLVGTPVFDPSWWLAYQRVNAAFAEATIAAMVGLRRPVLWVQDYHLMLVPQLLKQAGAQDVRFFMHIPWPAPELFSRLPWRKELLRGLLGADLLSFHTERYRKNFVRSVGRLLEGEAHRPREEHHVRGGIARTLTNPISIDADDFAAVARGEAVEERLTQLRRQFADRRCSSGSTAWATRRAFRND